MLLRSALGVWSAAPAVQGAAPLAYIQTLPPTLEAALALQPQTHWWRQLRTVAPYARVSGVASTLDQTARFARAVGSTCRVLLPQTAGSWALVVLPSGQLRFLANNTFVALGGAHPQSARFFMIPNAGWNRRAGRRPIVRGTARNPNDHPHGGRTRAIKYPRTP
jgi:ribosomal protein L2